MTIRWSLTWRSERALIFAARSFWWLSWLFSSRCMINDSLTETLSARDASSSRFMSSKCCRLFAWEKKVDLIQKRDCYLIVLEQNQIFLKAAFELFRLMILSFGYVIFVILKLKMQVSCFAFLLYLFQIMNSFFILLPHQRETLLPLWFHLFQLFFGIGFIESLKNMIFERLWFQLINGKFE